MGRLKCKSFKDNDLTAVSYVKIAWRTGGDQPVSCFLHQSYRTAIQNPRTEPSVPRTTN